MIKKWFKRKKQQEVKRTYGLTYKDFYNFDRTLFEFIVYSFERFKEVGTCVIPMSVCHDCKYDKSRNIFQCKKPDCNRWEETLEEIIIGFKAWLDFDDLNPKSSYEDVRKKLKRSLQLIYKHANSLWY